VQIHFYQDVEGQCIKENAKFYQMLKTGGGTSEFVAINDVDLTFKSILGNQIDALPAVYDSDDISSMYIIDFKHNFLL
jgi:hypothetical protein